MRIDDCNWMDVENYLKKDDRLMVILGACEQHGYLSLMTDTKVPVALADAAGQRTGVLVVPPVNFGVSPYFLTYPGTISLSSSTYLEVVSDLKIQPILRRCAEIPRQTNGGVHGDGPLAVDNRADPVHGNPECAPQFVQADANLFEFIPE